MNKKITAVAIAAVLSIGTIASVSSAHADRGDSKGVSSRIATILPGLVANGTLTQAQSDAITAALAGAAPIKSMLRKNLGAMEAVITSTLGITAADLQAAHVAGKSLATLAGDKKAALITALVNFKTTEIDAAVTTGKLTAAQATAMKSGLTARVTAMVEFVPGSKHGGMGKDRMGKGKKMHSPSIS